MWLERRPCDAQRRRLGGGHTQGMPDSMLEKIISGGQTGADQAGLLVARQFGLATGGWMPSGFLTSTGANPELAREFGLLEHTGGYPERTRANVRESDGTIRLAASFWTSGERCTLKWIKHYGKPSFSVEMLAPQPAELVVQWLLENKIRVLKVSGNSEPKNASAKTAGITPFVQQYLAQVLRSLGLRELPTAQIERLR